MERTGVRARIEQELGRGGIGGILAQEAKTLTVVGYVRHSEEELSQGKNGIEEQAARIEVFLDSQGWNLKTIYQDVGEPGDSLQRPSLLELIAQPDFEVLVVDTTDRLTCKKQDLDFMLALFDKLGITCLAATWSWDYLAQYMRHCFRAKGNKIYALLDQKEP